MLEHVVGYHPVLHVEGMGELHLVSEPNLAYRHMEMRQILTIKTHIILI